MKNMYEFYSAIHSVEADEDNKQAVFYLMNTTPNLNRWGVSDKALEEALLTILRKPLGCGPGYKIDGHYPDPIKIGCFTDSSKPNGYALGTAEITDETTWTKLINGEWGPISVIIQSYLERCSKCHTDLTHTQDPFNHECIREGEAYLEIQSFVFDRVDFVDMPAYPQAGFINKASARTQIPLELLASFYKGTENSPQSNSRVHGSPTQNPTQEERKKEMETEQLQEKITDLGQQLTEEKEAREQVESELGLLKEERHSEIVDQVLEARKQAALVPDPEAERETLAAYNDKFLAQLNTDAQRIIKAQGNQPGQPKAKNRGVTQDALKAAMDEARVRLFGFRSEAQ